MEYQELADLLSEFNSSNEQEAKQFENICSLASEIGYLIVPRQIDDFSFEFFLHPLQTEE